MNRHWGLLAIAGLGALFAFNVSGCSLIGLAAGSAADRRTPRFQRVNATELVSVSAGSRVSLLLHDSTRVEGIYRGAERIADHEYRELYDAFRASHPRGASFPAIGERVESEFAKGEFRAFVASGVELWQWRRGAFVVESGGRLEREDGSLLDLFEARDLAAAGALPMATALLLETKRGKERIAAHRVAMIHARHNRNAALEGFLVGLAVDVMIVAIIKSSAEASKGPDCRGDPTPCFLCSARRPEAAALERLVAASAVLPADTVVQEPLPAQAGPGPHDVAGEAP